MKRLVFLFAVVAMLLTACVPADDEFPTVPEITAPDEIEKTTIPVPTNAEGDLAEIS